MPSLSAGSNTSVSLAAGYTLSASGAYGSMQVAPPNPGPLVSITPAGASVGPFSSAVTVNLTASGAGIVYSVNLPPQVAVVMSSAAPVNNDGRPDGTIYIQTA